MDQIFNQFMKLIGDFRKKEAELLQKNAESEAQSNKMLENARLMVDQTMADFDQKIRKVKAYSNIAFSHTPERGKATAEADFDKIALDKLALQIDRSSTNDPFAKKLWQESQKMLKKLEREKEAAKEDCDKILKSVSNMSKKEPKFSNLYAENLDSEFAMAVMEFALEPMFLDLEDETQPMFGKCRIPLRLKPSWMESLYGISRKVFNGGDMLIPVKAPASAGKIYMAEYEEASEQVMLEGIRSYVLKVLNAHGEDMEPVEFFDPIGFSNTSLGGLLPLCEGENPLVRPVPVSELDLKNRLSVIFDEVSEGGAGAGAGKAAKRLLILHGFPQYYDGQTVAKVRQMAVNAQEYGLCMVITTKHQEHGFSQQRDVMELLESKAELIRWDGGFRKNPGKDGALAPFVWVNMPKEIPEHVKFLAERRPVADHGNDYLSRVGISANLPAKGNRKLTGIPYGIDKKGAVQNLDFEASNFATFISGASRSGKSTLLHTILTGLLANHHPDDIEIWLVDFKMTEFSRYTKHTPAHVRYILLDESPELVYDLLDRLTDILTKRQNIFMNGGWQKLDEVPPTKYMPAMFVIIDEFSVMSQIVADSAISGKEDYRVKLQMLLAKGAALGMHFIFSSQGFTSGSRGLTDFSKKQIQQRISMKTDYNEIKETLDLKSASDLDRSLMEELEVHHALVRIPPDKNGNHLLKTKVLYISDYGAQEQMIDIQNGQLSGMNKFFPQDDSIYVDKRTLIVDGSRFHEFAEQRETIEKHLLRDGMSESCLLCLGEPRRMMECYPVELSRGFCENMLVMASANEMKPAASLLLSIRESLKLQHRDMTIWTEDRDPIYRTLTADCGLYDVKTARGLDAVCENISQLRRAIEDGTAREGCYVLLGFETLLQDMAYQQNQSPQGRSSFGSFGSSGLTIEKREPGELGLLAQLNALTAGLSGAPSKPAAEESFDVDDYYDDWKPATAPVQPVPKPAAPVHTSQAYDAREDLKFILTRGPKLGVHFVVLFRNYSEFSQSKLDTSLFRHKAMFVMPKSDAVMVGGNGEGAVTAGLSGHSFRYTNGVDSVTFRPYLHPGLTWENWKAEDTLEMMTGAEEEEELLL